MTQLNDIELFQCKFVSDLFEYSAKERDCSSKIFIKAYVYSSLPKRITSNTFFMESLDITSAYEILKREKDLTRGQDVYPSYVMAWIGYIMQYFECTTHISQTVLYKKIKPDELYALYEAYHSLDNELVIKRISEAKNINLNLNNVEIMRRLKKL